MFIAFLETKCIIFCSFVAGQEGLTHLIKDLTLTTSLSQAGQMFGSLKVVLPFLCSIDLTTSGIISPAFLIVTTSPIRMSFLSI